MKKTFAYVGIAGALSMACFDIVLLGQPVSGSHFDIASIGAMDFISQQRAAVGSVGGLIASFFICFGFWFLKLSFEKINATLAAWLFISLSSMMFFGGAFHASYYFLVMQHGISYEMVSNFREHANLLSYLGVPGFIAGNVLFFTLALQSGLPGWLKYFSPLIINGVLLGVFYILPAPVGGYLKPAFINLSSALLFIAVLAAQHKTDKT